MKVRFLNYALGLLVLSAALASCIKNDVKELGNAGTARVRLSEAPANIQFFSPFSDVKTVQLVTVRRDEVSQSDVNQTVTVKLTNVPDSIDKYNTVHGTTFEPLPDSLFTVVAGKGVTRSGNVYTVTFNPGVTAVTIPVALNGAKWNLSHTYAMYFKITDPGGKQVSSSYKEVLAAVAVKNKWDGVYEVTSGTMVDIANGTLSHLNNYLAANGYDPQQWELRTKSPTECEVYDNYFFGGHYSPITSGTSYSSYGSFSIVVEFDPATDKVVKVTNYYGQPASNGRYAQLDPTGINQYDAATKTVNIKYNMVGGSLVAPNQVRSTWTETWKWIGDR
jgi:hypothetical protein